MRILTLCAVCAVLAACGQGSNARLASLEDSVSYVIGYQVGDNLKRQGAPLQPGAILRGLQEGFAGTPPALSDSQARSAMTGYQQKTAEAMQKTAEASRMKDSIAAGTNISEGEKFFADNARKPGVQTTKSGLQWKVVAEGKGPKPKPTNTVKVHYKGTLLSGVPFDSSYGRAPVEFALNEVIPGWTEAVGLMNAGAKYHFWIPAGLAYGPQGRPPIIGPNAALMFEIELLSFR